MLLSVRSIALMACHFKTAQTGSAFFFFARCADAVALVFVGCKCTRIPLDQIVEKIPGNKIVIAVLAFAVPASTSVW